MTAICLRFSGLAAKTSLAVWFSIRPLIAGHLSLGLVLAFILIVGAIAVGVRGRPSPVIATTLSGVNTIAPAVTLCVNTIGSGGCYTSIQAAINAASPGDSIAVALGIYNEHITMTNGVSIYGEGWANTIIDGGFSVDRPTVYIPSGVTASTVLSGVQVTRGGNGTSSSNSQGGGIAIWYSSPSIVNTWVYSNTAREGGGVFVHGGSPTFTNVPAWNNLAAQRGGGFYLQGSGVITVTGDLVDTNGTVWFNYAVWDGGGFFISGPSVTLSGLRVYWNTAQTGGGVYIGNTTSRTTLMFNDISLNSALSSAGGGGISTFNAGNLEILVNAMNWNTSSGSGGGASFGQSVGTVGFNFFVGNSATSPGGGVDVFGPSPGLMLQRNWFEANSSSGGGGVAVDSGGNPTIDANTFVSNTANLGGGIYLFQAGVVTMTNNIIARNVAAAGVGGPTGGGVVIAESPGRLINNTIADNDGDGVWFAQAEGTTIANNIIYGNTGDGIERSAAPPTTSFLADYNDLLGNNNPYQGLSAGPHDLALDPQFAGSGINLAAYFHIQNDSPLIGTGSLGFAPLRDIDGELRILDGTVSMGADEIAGTQYSVYLPVVTKNYN